MENKLVKSRSEAEYSLGDFFLADEDVGHRHRLLELDHQPRSYRLHHRCVRTFLLQLERLRKIEITLLTIQVQVWAPNVENEYASKKEIYIQERIPIYKLRNVN